MEPEPESATTARQNGGRSFGFALIIVTIAAVSFSLLIRQGMAPKNFGIRPAPTIQAAGWLNGNAPASADLRGKVIVIDAWAYWCERCRAKAPELVKLHETYHDRGVVFLGLTPEGKDVVAESKKFLDEVKFTWPSGYGATETLTALNSSVLPKLWVIDRKNLVIWEQPGSEPIEAAIERALAEQP